MRNEQNEQELQVVDGQMEQTIQERKGVLLT